MADNKDDLSAADQKALAELEKQLAKDKAAPSSAAKSATNTRSSDKSTTQSKPSFSSRKSSSNTKTADSSPKAKTGLLWFVTVINLLILIAIIGAGYWAWLQWQGQSARQSGALVEQQNLIATQQQKVTQTLAENQQLKAEIQQQNQGLQASVSSLVEQLQLTDSQTQSNQKQLTEISGRRPADWLLAEADYLVRMAGRKLWLEHDVKTAIMMLQSADSRIQDLDDPSLLPVREYLAADIQTLQQINQVSTSSIALALGAMLKQVDNLPLVFFERPKEEVTEQAVTDSVDDWRSNFMRNFHEVTKDFFSFKKVTTDIKPFMSEQQRWLLKEQLSFALMQAQIAVLQENQTLYQQALQQGFALLIEHFDTEQDIVVQFTESLSNLQQTDFSRNYPSQLEAAPLLQDVIESRLDSRFVNGSN
ncbi:uroporphyrinogen-III C-methyltransferase [uncultured Paraglaciecola sp.]|uniref:uroporphyrinogen-III C-methyltransferase n=1 Tax=uncultured Paraglaciecola sp. TaxID=1765024 RepID=UPI002598D320|nr:uroporphyrinogen-III C-methyltransferase [uncultured Paraglaciecola sp.]